MLRTCAAQFARRRGTKSAMVALALRIAVILFRKWVADTGLRKRITTPQAISLEGVTDSRET